MNEIDTKNIIGQYGTRATRGKGFNLEEAEKNMKAAGDELDDDDDEDDGDFVGSDAEDQDQEMRD
jgi:hypothetical protein